MIGLGRFENRNSNSGQGLGGTHWPQKIRFGVNIMAQTMAGV